MKLRQLLDGDLFVSDVYIYSIDGEYLANSEDIFYMDDTVANLILNSTVESIHPENSYTIAIYISESNNVIRKRYRDNYLI